MSAADLVARLAKEGIDPTLLAEVAQELFAGEIERKALEDRRKHERERKARSRSVTGQAVTGEEVTDKGSPEVSPRTPLPNPSKTAPLNPPKSRAKKAVSVRAPEWMPVELWLAFVAMRERMAVESRGKIIWSEDAAIGVIRKIDRLRAEGHCPAKLLEKAIVSSHRTVFEDETTRASKASQKIDLSAQELRERAEWFVRHGQPDRAEECRRKAIALEQRAAA